MNVYNFVEDKYREGFKGTLYTKEEDSWQLTDELLQKMIKAENFIIGTMGDDIEIFDKKILTENLSEYCEQGEEDLSFEEWLKSRWYIFIIIKEKEVRT